jgi:hypothetical protein
MQEDDAWVGQLREEFSEYDLDWNDLAGLASDRRELAKRLAAATGLGEDKVMGRIQAAETTASVWNSSLPSRLSRDDDQEDS